MSDIRDAILKQMLASGMTIYQVAKLVEGTVPQRTVYAFLTGEKDAGTQTASAILKAVGLTVTPRPKRRMLMETKVLSSLRNAVRNIASVERFTDRLLTVLERAQVEARKWNHHYLGTEHYLLALISEKKAAGAKVARSFGVSRAKVEKRIRKLIKKGPEGLTAKKLTETPRAKQAIKVAAKEARRMDGGHIGTEHLLLGLLSVGDGIAAQVLNRCGLALEDARERVAQLGREQSIVE